MKSITVRKAALSLLAVLLTCAPVPINSQEPRLVKMTIVKNASSIGAYCLDGSLPAYHLDRGFGAGARNWLLQFEGGGWCNDIKSCLERAPTRRGSTQYMTKTEVFSGILSNNATSNPDFYNWNRVKLRYCDGASFAGDATYQNGTSLLYFRGQRIWQAIIHDLLPKGLGQAEKALLSGCSAGGLATFHHCDNFTSYLPQNATVKCLSDAGFFLDAKDIAKNYTMRNFFEGVVSVQDATKNLNPNCTNSTNPKLVYMRPFIQPNYKTTPVCFFPQYALPYIKTPFFILNSPYDVYQIGHILAPPSATPDGSWNRCKRNIADCNTDQINTMQGFRDFMLQTLDPFLVNSTTGGMYINSCFTHCQSETQDVWSGPDSPRVHNKTISEAVGDWYFGRKESKEIDCPYPCDKSCHLATPKLVEIL